MRKLLALLVLSLAIVLGGCTNETTEPTVTDPTHIYEEVREDFVIDAEVIPFSGDGTAAIYRATHRQLTKEQISDFLVANGDGVGEWTNTLNPKIFNGLSGITLHGGSFDSAIHISGLYSGGFGYTLPSYEKWRNCHLYSGEQQYVNSAKYLFAHLFAVPKDFPFSSFQEAEANVRDLLAILGYDDLVLHRTLYIDHRILRDEVTPQLQTEEWQSEDKTGYNPTYDDWSEADDGYIFEFFLSVDGNPMLYQDINTDTLLYRGSSIQVWYQSSGIVYLYAPFSLWNVDSAIIDSVQVISATNALDIARVRLENTRGYTKSVIDKISGEYAYVADGDHFVLRPVWVVYAQFTNVYNDIITQQYVIIDAVTGDELM